MNDQFKPNRRGLYLCIIAAVLFFVLVCNSWGQEPIPFYSVDVYGNYEPVLNVQTGELRVGVTAHFLRPTLAHLRLKNFPRGEVCNETDILPLNAEGNEPPTLRVQTRSWFLAPDTSYNLFIRYKKDGGWKEYKLGEIKRE